MTLNENMNIHCYEIDKYPLFWKWTNDTNDIFVQIVKDSFNHNDNSFIMKLKDGIGTLQDIHCNILKKYGESNCVNYIIRHHAKDGPIMRPNDYTKSIKELNIRDGDILVFHQVTRQKKQKICLRKKKKKKNQFQNTD